MGKKNPKIAALISSRLGHSADPHYLGFFDCFNRQLFFEAHEVLEELWLMDRSGPNGDFYKGLIQLAGAFVHVQKNRPGPANALFELARTNLARFSPEHEHLKIRDALELIQTWQGRIAQAEGGISSIPAIAPQLRPGMAAFASKE